MIVGILLRWAKQCLATPKKSKSKLKKKLTDFGRIMGYEYSGAP